LDNLEGLTNQELLREFNNLRVPIMNAFDILFHCPKQGEEKYSAQSAMKSVVTMKNLL